MGLRVGGCMHAWMLSTRTTRTRTTRTHTQAHTHNYYADHQRGCCVDRFAAGGRRPRGRFQRCSPDGVRDTVARTRHAARSNGRQRRARPVRVRWHDRPSIPDTWGWGGRGEGGRGAGSGERGAGSGERGAGSGERGAGNGERGAGSGGRGAGSGVGVGRTVEKPPPNFHEFRFIPLGRPASTLDWDVDRRRAAVWSDGQAKPGT